jgi:hypothetical protein
MATMKSLASDEISKGVKLRHQVLKLVTSDIKHAYKLGKSITHPWYKCQALAYIAEHSSNHLIKQILEESFNSAMLCHDPNRRVTVACWPLKIAIENDLKQHIEDFMVKITAQINQNMDPLSKWCASDIVFTIKSNQNLLDNFFDTFSQATSIGYGWQVERMIKFMLADKEIQKNEKYIAHLQSRQKSIRQWKYAHSRAASKESIIKN